MKKNNIPWLCLILYALAYGAVMLSLGGIHAYEFSPYHRYQAEALLHGHLYLADSIYALEPGLVWHDGHVQHVFGLGVGLWLLPFEAVWRLFSSQPFPDRIALGLAFALLAFFSGNTGLRLIRQGQGTLGLAVICVIVLCPALWTLARDAQLAFEETVLYSILLSLGILVSLVRVASFDSRADYFLCCGLGAFAIWVRPTHAAYGLSAILMASLVLGMRRRSISEIASGTALWLASFTLLAWTNCVRFGSPLEFGHRLTVSSGTMMYLIRFGNPYHEAPLFQAAKELFGLLFLANPRGEYAFADNQFPGQSPFTRWRKLDFTTFDSTYAVVCLIVIVVAGFWLIRRRKQIALWRKPQGPVILCLLSWSGLSTIMMGVFYLHYPIIASRYLLDFAPAFAGFVMLACVLLRDNWARFLFPLVAVWLAACLT